MCSSTLEPYLCHCTSLGRQQEPVQGKEEKKKKLNLPVTIHFYRHGSYSIAGLFLEPVGIIYERSTTTAEQSGELKGLLHLSLQCWLVGKLSQD